MKITFFFFFFSIVLFDFFFFFFMNGNTERAKGALSRVCIPRKKEKKCNKNNFIKYLKRVIKTSKKCNKKKIMPSGP